MPLGQVVLFAAVTADSEQEAAEVEGGGAFSVHGRSIQRMPAMSRDRQKTSRKKTVMKPDARASKEALRREEEIVRPDRGKLIERPLDIVYYVAIALEVTGVVVLVAGLTLANLGHEVIGLGLAIVGLSWFVPSAIVYLAAVRTENRIAERRERRINELTTELIARYGGICPGPTNEEG